MANKVAPEISVIFRTKATTIIERSARGIMYMILEDSVQTEKYVTYLGVEDVKEAEWSASNYKLIQLAFASAINTPNKMVVRNIDSDDLATALVEFNNRKINYLCAPTLILADDTKVVTWVKSKYAEKGITYFSSYATGADDVTIIKVGNSSFKHKDLATTFTGQEYTSAYCSIFAGMPLNRSGDNLILPGVTEVSDTAPLDGVLTAYNDDGVCRIHYAINTKTTFDSTWKKETRKIKVVDGMNIVRFDISETFKDAWLGRYINDYQNKMAFCNIVNYNYFNALQPNVLSDDYDNFIDIDVTKHKETIVADGEEVDKFTDLEIRRYPTSDDVFLVGDVRFSDTMANLSLIVNM